MTDAYEVGRVLDELSDTLAELLVEAGMEDANAVEAARQFVTVEIAERLIELGVDVEL